MSDIDSILNPRKIAIVGASQDPVKRGFRAIRTLLADNYQGEIIPIHPKAGEILGLRCYPDLAAAPGEIDLALVCTGAHTVAKVIEQCGKKGVRGAIVLAGGLSEAGEAGRLLEEQIIETAKRYNVRLIGANTNGMFTARYNCNAIGWRDIPRGDIAVLSNSANIMVSLWIEAQNHKYSGYSMLLSVGNQSDILFHEYLESLGGDSGTRAIISYVEGFKNGRAYFDVARQVSLIKPIVMYKAGRNTEGTRAAKSHSGSMAGDYTVSAGVLKQAGVLMVTRSDFLYPIAEALTLLPPLKTRRVAILSEGGGPITVAAEALADRGMVLSKLTQRTQETIREIAPNASAIANPVDAGAMFPRSVDFYRACARAVLEDPNIDGLLLVGYFGGYGTRYGESMAAEENEAAAELADMMRQYGKPIVVQTHFGHVHTSALDILRRGGVPFQRSIETAVECLASAADYTAMKYRIEGLSIPDPFSKNLESQRILATCRNEDRACLLEHEARKLLGSYGIQVSPEIVITSPDELTTVHRLLGDGPVAMKVVSKDVLHKSDAGGVRLNLRGDKQLREAMEEIISNAHAYKKDAQITGVLVSPMAPKGVELIVGVAHDAQFGPVIMFGLGGVLVEVTKDVVFRALPISHADADEMIADIKGKAVLDGFRGIAAVDKPALIDLLLTISRLCQAHPELAEIDLNPVVAHERGYSIVDARIILSNCDASNRSNDTEVTLMSAS